MTTGCQFPNQETSLFELRYRSYIHAFYESSIIWQHAITSNVDWFTEQNYVV